MQFVIAIAMAGIAFLLPTSFFFAATLAVFWIMAFCSATHDIAADGYYMLELEEHQQAAFVGVRSTFYRIASVIGQGGLVVIAGIIERKYDDIPLSWSVVFAILSVFFLLLALYNIWAMPRSNNDSSKSTNSVGSIFSDFSCTFVTFFRKPYIWSALAFMLLYRLPEAMMLKLVQPFYVADRAVGGLGLTTEQVGILNGTTGVVGLLVVANGLGASSALCILLLLGTDSTNRFLDD